MGKKISKNISKNLSSKYSQKRLDHAKQIATDTFEMLQKQQLKKKTEATSDLIGKKIANKVTGVLKNSQQNNSGTVTNESD